MSLFNWFPADRQTVINGVRFAISYAPGSDEARYRVDLLSIPAISSAVEIKSNDVAQIPCRVYLRTDNGRVHQPGPLDRLLSQQPNRFQNAATFWKTVAMQATLGECYVSTRGGELTILPYGTAIRYVTSAGEVRYATTYTAGELQQMKNLPAGAPVIKDDFAYNEVLHFWTFQDEYGVPIPMRTRFRHVLGLGSDIYSYSCNVYNRGGVIAGYLSTDAKIADTQKAGVIQAFKSLFRGAKSQPQNADGSCSPAGNEMLMAAVDNGWKFNALNLSPQEMQLLQAKEDLQRDFAQITNMPLWKLGVLKDYHYSTAESAQREYLQSALNPLLKQIECELNCKLVHPLDRDALYIEFNREALVNIDAKTMAEVDDIAVKNGSMSTDEFRERRNLPHSGHGIFQIPVNVTSAEFLVKNEALKLESAALDVRIKAAQLAAGGTTTPATFTIPAPADPASQAEAPPAAAEADGATAADAADVEAGEPATDYVASLRSIRAKHAADLTAERMADPDAMAAIVRAVCADVGALHGVADHLAAFADKYTASANKRISGGKSDPAYEMSRAVNAANHEAMRLAHGVRARVRWVGGANDGQSRCIMEPWAHGLRHPPLSADDVDCFLVPDTA